MLHSPAQALVPGGERGTVLARKQNQAHSSCVMTSGMVVVTKVFVSMNWFMFWYFTYKVNLLEPETTELWDSFASQGYMELNSCFWFIVQTPPAWAVPPAPLQAAVTVTHSGVGCSC